MKLKRVVNIRCLFFAAAACGAGILLACLAGSYLNIILIAALTAATGGAAFFILQRKHFAKTWIALTLCFVFFGAGFAGFKLKQAAFTAQGFAADAVSEISGELTEGFTYSGDGFTGVLTDVRIGGKRAGGKLYLSVSGLGEQNILQFAGTGDTISFSSAVRYNAFYGKGGVTQNAVKNIKYSVRLPDDVRVRVESGRMPFFASLRQRITENIMDVMGAREGAIAVGMLIGTQDMIDPSTSYYYSATGISHVLSVSGLHISFVAGIIMMLLDKLQGHRSLKFALLTAVLLFYTAVCGFVPPAMRALLMASAAYGAKAFGKRSDALNNLGFAALALIIVNPLLMFNISFQMSFAATLGIVCLSGQLQRLMSKAPLIKKTPEKFRASLAMIISAQLGVSCITLITMQTLTLYVALANLILVPVLIFAFFVLFAAVFASLILPFLKWLAVIAYPVIWAVNEAARLITKLPFSTILVFSLPALAVVTVAAVYACSRYLLRKGVRLTAFALLVLLLIGTGIPLNVREKSPQGYQPVGTAIGLNAIICENGKYYAAGDFRDRSSVLEALRERNILRLDGVILTNVSREGVSGATAVIKKYAVKTVYVPDIPDAALREIPDTSDIVFLKDGRETGAGQLNVTVFITDGRAGALLLRQAGGKSLILLSSSDSFAQKITAPDGGFWYVQSYHGTEFAARNSYVFFD